MAMRACGCMTFGLLGLFGLFGLLGEPALVFASAMACANLGLALPSVPPPRPGDLEESCGLCGCASGGLQSLRIDSMPSFDFVWQ